MVTPTFAADEATLVRMVCLDDDNQADKQAKEAFKSAVIDRLFALNAERAKEEALMGLGKVKKGAAAEKPLKAKGSVRPTRPPAAKRGKEKRA